MEEKRGDISGLLAIRGSVQQALGNRCSGLADYREMLRLRVHAHEDDGRIGEAESELGWGYLQVANIVRAGFYLRSGVARLERSNRREFTVRGQIKLAVFYFLTLRIKRGRELLHRAKQSASDMGATDQLSQIDRILGTARKFLGNYVATKLFFEVPRSTK